MSTKSLFRFAAAMLVVMLIFPALSYAAPFSVNPHRFDPYKQFKFRVKWDGRYISQIVRVSGLTRKTEVVAYRLGSNQSVVQKTPGKTIYEPITLVRGRTHDTAFEEWANKAYNVGSGLGSEVSLQDFRKDIIIELFNEAGQLVMAFKVNRCWPSQYSAVNEFDAMSKDIALETLVLEHEGWERDYSVTEPVEPSFTEP